jgi:hypothetical protein
MSPDIAPPSSISPVLKCREQSLSKPAQIRNQVEGREKGEGEVLGLGRQRKMAWAVTVDVVWYIF